MAMSHDDWMMIKAKIGQMEEAVGGLKSLRDGGITLSDSLLHNLDYAISESEKIIALLKNTMVN